MHDDCHARVQLTEAGRVCVFSVRLCACARLCVFPCKR